MDQARPVKPRIYGSGKTTGYEQIDAAVTNGVVADRPSPRKVLDIIELMMSDGVNSPTDPAAKDCIVEGTNLMDKYISQALAELWDSMLVTRANAVTPTNA